MTVYYLDILNGDDGGDGLNWGTAIKSPNAIALVSGDEMRISKSPDPVSIGNVSWVNNSEILTLPSNRTELIEDCVDIWSVVSPNTVSRYTAQKKSGAACVLATISSAFTTGKSHYKSLPASLDLSAYQGISFWFYGNNTIDFRNVSFHLCSDSDGNTPVDILTFNVQGQGTAWGPLDLFKDGGGNLGNNINSIAIYVNTKVATSNQSFRFDHIIAIKQNDISLASLIGKYSTFNRGQEGFFPIKHIYGTLVTLDGGPLSWSTNVDKYAGDTETKESFVVHPYYMSGLTSTVSAGFPFRSIAAFLDPPVKYRGGFQVGTDIQNGQTFIMGNGYGRGIRESGVSNDNWECERINPSHFYYGISPSAVQSNIDCFNVAGCYFAFNMNNCHHTGEVDNVLHCSLGQMDFTGNNCYRNKYVVHNAFKAGALRFTSNAYQNYVELKDVRYSGLYAVIFSVSGGVCMDNTVKLLKYTPEPGINTSISSFTQIPSVNYIIDSDLRGLNLVNVTVENTYIAIKDCIWLDDTFYHRRKISKDGVLTWITDVKETPQSPGSWGVSVGNISIYTAPIQWDIAQIAVNANKLVTVSLKYAFLDLPWACRAILKIQDDSTLGVSNVASNEADYSDDQWRELTLSFTPANAGVVQVFLEIHSQYGQSRYVMYFGSISVTQAD